MVHEEPLPGTLSAWRFLSFPSIVAPLLGFETSPREFRPFLVALVALAGILFVVLALRHRDLRRRRGRETLLGFAPPAGWTRAGPGRAVPRSR